MTARMQHGRHVIARSVSDEAIQQERAKASSKRKALAYFAAVHNDEEGRWIASLCSQ
jgi:hypothetical protein